MKVNEAASFMIELYRRFRRYNAAAYAVTQSLQDFVGENAKGLLQNTTYHYLLRLPGEDALVQELLEMSDRGIEVFRSLTSRSGSFSEVLTWIRREDRLEGDVMIVRPTPVEYWAYTTNAYDMAKRKEVLDEHGGNLVAALDELAAKVSAGSEGVMSQFFLSATAVCLVGLLSVASAQDGQFCTPGFAGGETCADMPEGEGGVGGLLGVVDEDLGSLWNEYGEYFTQGYNLIQDFSFEELLTGVCDVASTQEGAGSDCGRTLLATSPTPTKMLPTWSRITRLC